MAAPKIIERLSRQGLPAELLAQATGDWRLRADLGLSSAETYALQLDLEQAGCSGLALWDHHEYSLDELDRLLSKADSRTTAGGRNAASDLPEDRDSDASPVMPLNQRLAARLREGGDQLALIGAAGQFSYRQLGTMVAATRLRLEAAGLRAGDRLAFQLGNGHAAVVLLLAALLAGIVPVPMLPASRRHELRHVLGMVRP